MRTSATSSSTSKLAKSISMPSSHLFFSFILFSFLQVFRVFRVVGMGNWGGGGEQLMSFFCGWKSKLRTIRVSWFFYIVFSFSFSLHWGNSGYVRYA